MPTGSLTSGGTASCGKCPKNIFLVDGEVVTGITAAGERFIFDVDDFETVSQYNWYLSDGYVYRNLKGGGSIALHTALMGNSNGLFVDHINWDRSDNRRANLRWATKSQNAINSGLSKVNKTGFKGVSFHKLRKKYRARIKFNGREIHLGLFVSPEEAAKAYNQKATELFGEYAFLNIV